MSRSVFTFTFFSPYKILISLFCFIWIACVSEMKKGSDQKMYTISSTLEVNRKDIGKDIQLTLNQKLMFNFIQ